MGCRLLFSIYKGTMVLEEIMTLNGIIKIINNKLN
jgi:hypothetical protein